MAIISLFSRRSLISPAGSFDTELGLSLAETHGATSTCGGSRVIFEIRAVRRLLCSRIFGPLINGPISSSSSWSLSLPTTSPPSDQPPHPIATHPPEEQVSTSKEFIQRLGIGHPVLLCERALERLVVRLDLESRRDTRRRHLLRVRRRGSWRGRRTVDRHFRGRRWHGRLRRRWILGEL